LSNLSKSPTPLLIPLANIQSDDKDPQLAGNANYLILEWKLELG